MASDGPAEANPAKLQPSVQQIASIIPAIQRCPEHTQWIVLPLFGFRACCLLAALQRIQNEPEKAKEIVDEVLAGRPAKGVLPKLWRRK